MKKTIYLQIGGLFIAFFLTASNLQAQCLDWVNPTDTTGWNDFQTFFGGAPCDDGSGCPFNEIDAFEVFASEAYSIDNFVEGSEYAFSMCNGPGAGSWIPEFTIIAPSGAVDAFGPGDGDNCTITWTASESGTYLIVINEEGECGGGPNTATANGFPALTCTSGPPCNPPVTACNAGNLTTNGTVSICDAAGTFDLAVETDTVPTGGGYGWSFSDGLGGTGGAAGGFTITNSTQMETFDSDLNGILSFNMLDVLSGAWVIRGVTYDDANDPTGTICSATADSLIVFFGTESPAIDDVVDAGNGSATVTASGGVMPYTYLWSDSEAQTTETAVNLAPGNYTVTVTDANGCTAEGTVEVISTAVENVEALESLLISPNPTSGQFTVQMTLNKTENVKVEVMDVAGRTLANANETTHATSFTFDLSNQPAGIYFLKITAGEQFLARRLVLAK